MANVARLKALREVITRNPEKWDQHAWAAYANGNVFSADFDPDAKEVQCGTTYCMAGWTCINEGLRLDWTKGTDEKLFDEDNDTSYEVIVTGFLTTGEMIEVKARELLELEEDEAYDLFFAMNKDEALDQLDRLISQYDTVDA